MTKTFSKLRQQAETKLSDTEDLSALSVLETERLIHELRVHQIELELQNEELRNARQEVEIAYQRYVDLYDSIPVGCLTVDNNGIILQANLTSTHLLSVTRGTLIGQQLSTFVASEYQDVFYLYQRKILASKTRQICELKLKQANGSEFLAQLQGIAIEELKNPPLQNGDDSSSNSPANESKKYLQYNLIIIDINELKKNEAALVKKDEQYDSVEKLVQERTKELAKVNQQLQLEIVERQRVDTSNKQHLQALAHASRLSLLGEMTSAIAHEINQPLTAIAAYTEACKRFLVIKPKKSPKITATLEGIIQQTQRAGNIIRRLKDFSRNTNIYKSYININKIFKKIIHLIEIETRQHDVTMRLEFSEPSPQILADSILIEQVILNLTHNAIEVMDSIPKHKRILTLQTTLLEGNKIQVAVADTGLGLSDKTLKRIFEPFFSTKPEGIGLGLSICQSIIKAHDGHIWALQNANGGTTFRFILPIKE
jgi:PAS domain S-box-containing protein